MSKFPKPDLTQNKIKSGEQGADYLGDSKNITVIVDRIKGAPSMKPGGYLTNEGARFKKSE